ncbi:MAG: hypothetical protein K0R08_481 [Solimicrobium sp.]|jgi:hypothetical protein|nr:hypothetical protein [Solimicrobium sp.]
MNTKKILVVALAAAMQLNSTSFAATPTFGTPQPAYPNTFKAVTPNAYSGNFVSSGDNNQVCYDMVAYMLDKRLIEQPVTGDLHGFKIDAPTNSINGPVAINISTGTSSIDKKYLAFALDPGASMVGVIVKGGTNFNLYNYVNKNLMSDSWLSSPYLTGKTKVPEISHYNVCYTIEPQVEHQGCTPGYWRNHADRWYSPTGEVTPTASFETVFGVDPNPLIPDFTLGTGIINPQFYGTFVYHAIAALLNSYGGTPNMSDSKTVSYPYTPEDVLKMVQDAVAEGTIETTKNQFAAANELGCPLSGTRAVAVENSFLTP